MPRTSSLASVEIDVGEKTQAARRSEPDTPFRILVVGDFGGSRKADRAPIFIDRDNFDEIVARVAPQLQLRLGQKDLAISFRELDDFHPDRLLNLEPFHALDRLRRRLSDPATFSAAAAEIAPSPSSGPSRPPNVSGAELLREMMGEQRPAAPAPARSDWDRMLRELVAPYAEPRPDPRQPELIGQVDAAISGEMRSLLHAPQFQALESAWRGLFFLVRRLVTGEDLQVFLLDLPQEQLPAMESIVVDEAARTPGAVPWAAIAGLYSFGAHQEDELLKIGQIASRAHAPFLAGLAPDVVGLTRVFEWLRRAPEARWIGLALPRFLLRLPYGAATDSTERFVFEEMPAKPEHERYLWCNPSIACAYLLGAAFSGYGWRMRPGLVQDIDGLPAHVYKSDGESQLKPCAEVLLTEDAAGLLLDRGFMPLLSIKGADRVRLARFQSIAEPHAALAGRWE